MYVYIYTVFDVVVEYMMEFLVWHCCSKKGGSGNRLWHHTLGIDVLWDVLHHNADVKASVIEAADDIAPWHLTWARFWLCDHLLLWSERGELLAGEAEQDSTIGQAPRDAVMGHRSAWNISIYQHLSASNIEPPKAWDWWTMVNHGEPSYSSHGAGATHTDDSWSHRDKFHGHLCPWGAGSASPVSEKTHE